MIKKKIIHNGNLDTLTFSKGPRASKTSLMVSAAIFEFVEKLTTIWRFETKVRVMTSTKDFLNCSRKRRAIFESDFASFLPGPKLRTGRFSQIDNDPTFLRPEISAMQKMNPRKRCNPICTSPKNFHNKKSREWNNQIRPKHAILGSICKWDISSAGVSSVVYFASHRKIWSSITKNGTRKTGKRTLTKFRMFNELE